MSAVGTLGGINNINWGGSTFFNLQSDPKARLLCFSTGGAGANNTTPRRMDSNGFAMSGYQVTNGKTLIICGAYVNGTGASNFYLGYADNDVGYASNTAFTNGKEVGGGTIGTFSIATIAAGMNYIPIPMMVGSAEYVAVLGGANGFSGFLICVEV